MVGVTTLVWFKSLTSFTLKLIFPRWTVWPLIWPVLRATAMVDAVILTERGVTSQASLWAHLWRTSEIRLSEMKRPTTRVGSTTLWTEYRETGINMSTHLLLPDCGHNETNCLRLLPTCLPRHKPCLNHSQNKAILQEVVFLSDIWSEQSKSNCYSSIQMLSPKPLEP